MLFFAAMAAGVVLVLELFSALVFYAAEGKAFSRAENAERRRQLAGDPGRDGTAPDLLGNLRHDDVAQVREVIHPFLGFTFNPALNEREERLANNELLISRDGFFYDPGNAEKDAQADLRIGIFGGSVAFMFCFEGRERLLDVLSAVPGLVGKSIAVDCRALGGYKQPQQLLALTYDLARGRHYDSVVNIDGFNEVALSYTENYERGVTPYYPRQWKDRVETLPDLKAQWLVGRVVFVRQQRARLARRFSSAPWDGSVTVNLVWRLLDRWLAQDLVATQQAVAGYVPEENDYLWQGPFETYPDRSQALQAMVDVWRASSLQMHRLARANNVYYFHVLQPNQYDSGSKVLERGERRVAISEPSPYGPITKEAYDLLRASGEELRRQGVRFADLSGIFREVDEPLYIDSCCHFNQRGNVLMADAIGRFVRQSLAD